MVYNILSPRKQISLVFLLTSLQFNLSLLLTSSNWNTALLRCPFKTCYIKEEYAKISFTFINFFPRFLDPCHISYECLMLGKSFSVKTYILLTTWGDNSTQNECIFQNPSCIFLHIFENLLITEATWTWASVTTSTMWSPLSMSMLIPFKKQAFSRFVLFFSVTRLSMVMMHSMVLVSYSMKVYEQYCAQCPGLSILPSPV